MQDFSGNLIETLSRLAFPKIGIIDIIQIALIAFFVYQFMVWIKYTHAYTLLKGILVVLLFILIAYIFRMNTILWIFSNLASTLIVGVIVIFQPDLVADEEEIVLDRDIDEHLHLLVAQDHARGIAGVCDENGARVLVDLRFDLLAVGVAVTLLRCRRDGADVRAAGVGHRRVVGVERLGGRSWPTS